MHALRAQFDDSPEDEELITNDDEWLWGEHKKKVRCMRRAGKRKHSSHLGRPVDLPFPCAAALLGAHWSSVTDPLRGNEVG